MLGTPARAGRHPLTGLLVRSALIGGAIAAVATPFAQSRAWFRSDPVEPVVDAQSPSIGGAA